MHVIPEACPKRSGGQLSWMKGPSLPASRYPPHVRRSTLTQLSRQIFRIVSSS
jgi:hypothetical protein